MSKPARPSLSAILPAKGAAARPEPLPEAQEPPVAAKAVKEERQPVTLKLRKSVYERLRQASFSERTDKQDLADQALDELLGRMGY